MSSNGYDATVLQKSVTSADHADYRQGATLSFFVGGTFGLPGMPKYWSQERDQFLRRSMQLEAFWSGAVKIAISKIASKGFDFSDANEGSGLRVERAQQLLLHADAGKGWVKFLYKHLQDYFLTDNGAFVEIVRASSAAGSRVLGIMHLDSCRCLRTGDPAFPLLYRDREGAEHVLRDYQVMDFVDSPDPAETYNGVGHCAAASAWTHIQKMAAIDTYVVEKVTGRRPLSVHLIGGITDTSLGSILLSAQSEATAKGAVAYMGAVMAAIPGDTPPTLITIPLAEIPDHFNRKEEFDIAILAYANALGLDVQDLQPLGGRPLGTGMQSEVLDDKASGKGAATWQQDFIHNVNEKLIPASVTFAFTERDFRDQKQAAEIDQMHIDAVASAIGAAVINPQQGLQMLVDHDVLPREFLPTDETPGQSLSDTEKPLDVDAMNTGTPSETLTPNDPQIGGA